MPNNPIDVERLVNELGDQGAINLDLKIRDLLKPTGIGIANPIDPVSDNVVAWSDYVLITSGKANPIRDVEAVANRVVRGLERGGGN